MRVPTGSSDRYLYFVAVDETDFITRETGLTTFSAWYSLNGAAETAYTTPTVTEIDATNMPGVYALLLDEGNTLNSAHDEAEMCIHITQEDMAPVTRTYELFRPKITEGQTVTAANGAADADIERLQGSAIATPTVAGVLEVDVTHWIGTAAATPTVAGVPEVDITHYLGTAAQGASGRPQVDIELWLGSAPNALVSGRVDASVGAMAANVLTATAINADAITAAKLAADVTTELQSGLATAANLATVDNVVDAILVDTAEIGAAGAGLTNINLPDQTMNITGNITGNLSGSVGSVTGLTASDVGAIKAVTDKLDDTLEDDAGTFRFTENALEEAPTGGSAPTASEIADEVQTRTIASVTTIEATGLGAIADAVHDEAVEGAVTLRQSVRLANAALGGKASGLDTNAPKYRDLGDTKDRIDAVTDANGNRTAVTRDLT